MQIGVSYKIKKKNRMANSVVPDAMACYEPSHLDLLCLHRYLSWSAWLKGLWVFSNFGRVLQCSTKETIFVTSSLLQYTQKPF